MVVSSIPKLIKPATPDARSISNDLRNLRYSDINNMKILIVDHDHSDVDNDYSGRVASLSLGMPVRHFDVPARLTSSFVY